jgi:hypothetical protein
MSLSQDNIIKLDVGGTRYKTTLNTLISYPESMIANMFSGRHKLDVDSDGYYFIDRDGEIFKYIMKFLRDKTLNLDGLSDSVIRDIITEADYYNINDLVVLCEKKINNNSIIDNVCSDLYGFNMSEFSREFNIIFSPDMLKKYDCVNTIEKIDIEPYHIYKKCLYYPDYLYKRPNSRLFITTTIKFQLYKYDESNQTYIWFPSIETNQEKNQEKIQALNFIKKWIKIFVNQDNNYKSFSYQFTIAYHNIQTFIKDCNIFNAIINLNLINHPYDKIECSINSSYIYFKFYNVI